MNDTELEYDFANERELNDFDASLDSRRRDPAQAAILNMASRVLVDNLSVKDVVNGGTEIHLLLPGLQCNVVLPEKDHKCEFPISDVETGGRCKVRISSGKKGLEVFAFPIKIGSDGEDGLGSGRVVYLGQEK